MPLCLMGKIGGHRTQSFSWPDLSGAIQSCSFRLVVATRAPGKAVGVAASLPEFDVGKVGDGLPVAAVAGSSRAVFSVSFWIACILDCL
jgi:hypothetical protein